MADKLCPMIKIIYTGPTETLEKHTPCIQEKCAWYVIKERYVGFDEANRLGINTDHITEGHCAVLDVGGKR